MKQNHTHHRGLVRDYDGKWLDLDHMMKSNRPLFDGMREPNVPNGRRPWVADVMLQRPIPPRLVPLLNHAGDLTEHEMAQAQARDFMYDGAEDEGAVVPTIPQGFKIETVWLEVELKHGSVAPEVQATVRAYLIAQERELSGDRHWRKLLAAAVRRIPRRYAVRTIAEATGIPKSTIQRWRNGATKPSAGKSGTPHTTVRREDVTEVLEQLLALRAEVSEVKQDAAETRRIMTEAAARLRERFPTDAEVTEAVEKLIASAA